MWQGAVGVSDYCGIVSPAYVVARPTEGIISGFFSRQLKRPDMLNRYQRLSQGNSKDTLTLKFDAFSKIVVMVPPEVIEQRQIATAFDQFDDLITLHQRKLDVRGALPTAQIPSICATMVVPFASATAIV